MKVRPCTCIECYSSYHYYLYFLINIDLSVYSYLNVETERVHFMHAYVLSKEQVYNIFVIAH